MVQSLIFLRLFVPWQKGALVDRACVDRGHPEGEKDSQRRSLTVNALTRVTRAQQQKQHHAHIGQRTALCCSFIRELAREMAGQAGQAGQVLGTGRHSAAPVLG